MTHVLCTSQGRSGTVLSEKLFIFINAHVTISWHTTNDAVGAFLIHFSWVISFKVTFNLQSALRSFWVCKALLTSEESSWPKFCPLFSIMKGRHLHVTPWRICHYKEVQLMSKTGFRIDNRVKYQVRIDILRRNPDWENIKIHLHKK